MSKEILLYNNINSYSASDFIIAMAENSIVDDICIRICGGGGDPVYGFGMIAKIQEHKGKTLIKVDGEAHSMYAFMLCYVEDSEALEVAEFIIHRAAYPDWFENDPEYFTPEVKANVVRVNDFLQKAFESKIDVAKFETITGVKLKNIFSLDSRIEVTLTASDAKKIGLINRIIKITPQKTAEIKSLKADMVARHLGIKMVANNPKNQIETKKLKKMNVAEFKAKYPKTYAKAMKEGADQENDRIGACLVYVEIDPAGVKEAIKSRKPLSSTQMAEFSLKALSGKKLDEITDDSVKEVITKEAEQTFKTEADKKFAEQKAEFKKLAGLK